MYYCIYFQVETTTAVFKELYVFDITKCLGLAKFVCLFVCLFICFNKDSLKPG